MSVRGKQMGWLGAGVLWAVLCGLPAMADDTELFLGNPNATTAQPNVLFVLDNSGSMATLVQTQTTYDPATTYPSEGCSATQVYWRTGAGNPPACNTDRWFNESALRCNVALQAFGGAGFYTDMLAQYDPTNGGGGKRWETISTTQKDRLVECQDDDGAHGDGSPAADVFACKSPACTGVADNAWVSNSVDGVTWGNSPANQVYTIYDGNYLNWYYGPTGFQTRLQVVQDVATSLLDTINGVNVGMMTFNPDQGGWVVHAMEDIGTARAAMQAEIDALTPTGWTPLSETLYEAAQYYRGGAVDYGNPNSVAASRNPGNANLYASPLDEFSCHNFVVYLTDGEPTRDVDADNKIVNMSDATGASFASLQEPPAASCDMETYPPGFNPSGGECLDDLAEFMQDGDQSPAPGMQNVTTYTIGFTVDLEILRDTATRGGGAYYTANDTASLSTAMSNILRDILDTPTTFISPAVSVNSFNRTRNLNDLYVSVFKPSAEAHWPGNLKKYELRSSDGAIIDANGAPAVSSATGFFDSNAQSFWSPAPDGADVTAGGAANLIPIPAARQVYTYLGNSALTDASNRVEQGNAAITDALLNTGLPGDPTRDEVIDFINGLDVPDTNQNNITNEPRAQMGDPLHAQPVSVIYGPAVTDAMVYFATNDGFLHAVNSTTGVEEWAFVPPEFMDSQVDLFVNDTTASKHYGIDGSLRVQVLADSDGTIETGEKVYLFFGLRRGGDTYYGLDITNPQAPRLLWRRDSTSLPGIGQSWTSPVPTRMDIQGAGQNADKFVLVIGGGYEPDQDSDASSTDATGNSIYILDSELGTLLWHGSRNGRDKDFARSGAAMDYSIPADVKVVDFDGDGFADRMYAADMGGQIWRFDVLNGQPASGLINGGVIAQLGSAPQAAPPASETRRFYYSPDVALVSNADFNFVHVGIGSGHREHPLGLVNEDRFYALRDYNAFGKLTQADYDAITPVLDTDLVDITDNVGAVVPQGNPGWRFELRAGGWLGEKVLAEARTFNNQVFFTTFLPPDGTGSSCDPQPGKNRLYVMSLFNGAPVNNLDGSVDPNTLTETDRYREFEGSIASEVVFIFPSGDPGCVGQQCAPPPIACVDLFCFPPGFANDPIRTFWTQESID